MIKRLVCLAGLIAACGAAPVFSLEAAEPLVPAPQGAPLLLEVMADGVQVYSCEPKGQGFEWTFKAPEANLFDKQGLQIGAHFAGPSWKFGDATIVGEVMSRADAPASGAIPCTQRSRQPTGFAGWTSISAILAAGGGWVLRSLTKSSSPFWAPSRWISTPCSAFSTHPLSVLARARR